MLIFSIFFSIFFKFTVSTIIYPMELVQADRKSITVIGACSSFSEWRTDASPRLIELSHRGSKIICNPQDLAPLEQVFTCFKNPFNLQESIRICEMKLKKETDTCSDLVSIFECSIEEHSRLCDRRGAQRIFALIYEAVIVYQDSQSFGKSFGIPSDCLTPILKKLRDIEQ